MSHGELWACRTLKLFLTIIVILVVKGRVYSHCQWNAAACRWDRWLQNLIMDNIRYQCGVWRHQLQLSKDTHIYGKSWSSHQLCRQNLRLHCKNVWDKATEIIYLLETFRLPPGVRVENRLFQIARDDQTRTKTPDIWSNNCPSNSKDALLKATVSFVDTDWVCHVWHVSGWRNFWTTEMNSLASNNSFSHRIVFQTGVNTLSKIVNH